jgi:hypothetical protein
VEVSRVVRIALESGAAMDCGFLEALRFIGFEREGERGAWRG